MSFMGTTLRLGLRSTAKWILGKVGKLVSMPVRRRLAAFEAATFDPERVQKALLQSIVTNQLRTQFGRDHHFNDIRTIEEFRHNVPVAGYDYVEPYLARVRRGETNALLSDPRV